MTLPDVREGTGGAFFSFLRRRSEKLCPLCSNGAVTTTSRIILVGTYCHRQLRRLLMQAALAARISLGPSHRALDSSHPMAPFPGTNMHPERANYFRLFAFHVINRVTLHDRCSFVRPWGSVRICPCPRCNGIRTRKPLPRQLFVGPRVV